MTGRRKERGIGKDSEIGTAGDGEMDGLLSRHLSRTSMAPTFLPSRGPSQSLPPRPLPLSLAPQRWPRRPPVAPPKALTSRIRGRKRGGGVRMRRGKMEGVYVILLYPRLDIKAMIQTRILTNWKLTCCLWMVRLWTLITLPWKTPHWQHNSFSLSRLAPNPNPSPNLAVTIPKSLEQEKNLSCLL